MNKKQYVETIKAILYGSGLDPIFDGDYYQDNNAEARARFIEGLQSVFGENRSSFRFHYTNLDWLDTPSETIDYLVENRDAVINGFPD